MQTAMSTDGRELVLSLWKAHILRHAATEPVVGLWMMRELRRHGYEVSPGTLYPLLDRMRRNGWLQCKLAAKGGRHARKSYRLTPKGRDILGQLRQQVGELWRELK